MLIVLELTVVRWGWYFNLDYRHTSLQVLWAIGASMILMAPLIVLHSRVVGAIGLTIVALHNAVGPIVRGSAIGESWPWALLYERGRVLTLAPEVSITVSFLSCRCSESWRWATHSERLIWMGLVRPERSFWHAFITIGRVPMLFYLLHVPGIHLAACTRGRLSEMPLGCSRARSIAVRCRCRPDGGSVCWVCTLRQSYFWWRCTRCVGDMPISSSNHARPG